jgi:hypothetical protein
MMHIIRRQYLHVELNGTESAGLALQRSLPGLCLHGLLPAIERALEQCTPPDGRHLYVKRLEIDAGTLALDRLEHDLSESVAHAVEKSLREQIEQIPPHRSSLTTVSSNVQHKTAQQSINEVFVHFLKTGSLPWWFRLSAGISLEQAVLDSWRKPKKSGIRAINETILRTLASPIAAKRLVHQFSSLFLETLLCLLSPESKKVLDGVLKALRNPDTPLGDVAHFERQLWGTAFSRLAGGGGMTATYLAGEAWKTLPPAARDAELARLLERQWPGITDKPSKIRSETRLMQRAHPVSEALPGSSEHPEAAEGIYIGNAGIVLLHPFLLQLFGALGIAAGDKLLQPERALCLLYFLATGKSVAPEYELLLPKILCNVPLDTPVESGVELTDAEKEEGMALLDAVIRHWGALRNTSPDGLRGTFFIRPGKISLRYDGDWLLQVETNSYDILMDSLPWSISMIKLPWMQRMLWVEWA